MREHSLRARHVTDGLFSCSSGGCYSPQNPRESKYSKSGVLEPPKKVGVKVGAKVGK